MAIFIVIPTQTRYISTLPIYGNPTVQYYTLMNNNMKYVWSICRVGYVQET